MAERDDETGERETGAPDPGAELAELLRRHGPRSPWRRLRSVVALLGEPVVWLMLGLAGLAALGTLAVLMQYVRQAPEKEKTAPSAAEAPPADKRPEAPDARAKPQAERDLAQGVRWSEVASAYQAEEWERARRGYRRLARLAASPGDRHRRMYFRLREAQCLRRLNRTEEARQQLGRLVRRTIPPPVRMMANYELAQIEFDLGLFLRARRRVYAALAVEGWLRERAPDLLATRPADASFLVARALTEQTLARLGRAEAVADVWTAPAIPALFAGLETAKRLLESSASYQAALLGPRIRRARGPGASVEWRARSAAAPLDQVMALLASKTGTDVRWMGVSASARQRAVTLDRNGLSEMRLAEVAAGSVGLIARHHGDHIRIHDPTRTPSALEGTRLVRREAISAWRRFFLRRSGDPRVAEGHFAIGVMRQLADEPATAIDELSITVQRFPRSAVAPHALLRMARIRIAMRDYAGARESLTRLLDSYPEAPAIDEAHVELGRAAAKTGQLQEARRAFAKAFYLDQSLSAKLESALRAAKIDLEKGRPKRAAQWARKHVELARERRPSALPEGLFVLGKALAGRGKGEAATETFRKALERAKRPAMRARLVLRIAELRLEREQYARALHVLDRLPGDAESDMRVRAVLLRARLFRRMGLPERAANLLQQRIERYETPEHRHMLRKAFARTLAETGERRRAHEVWMELLPDLPEGRATQEATLAAAALNLRMGRADQALALLAQLERGALPGELRKRHDRLAARAHRRNGAFARAAAVLGARQPDAEEGP